jgi:serine protease AprX
MTPVDVLIEFEDVHEQAFGLFSLAAESPTEGAQVSENLLDRVAGLGVELDEQQLPVPMLSQPEAAPPKLKLQGFATAESSPDLPSATTVVGAKIPEDQVEELGARPGVSVWLNPELVLLETAQAAFDCGPFAPGASIEEIQSALGVEPVWAEAGTRGEGIVIGIIDEGINDQSYRVQGGFRGPGAPAVGGSAINSHGSMCAADCLIAAPDATFYDYPFLGVPNAGGALAMFQAVLNQRRLDGTPQLTNSSYGFMGVPPREQAPKHPIWDLQHPLHRKIREVVAAGVPAFFSAGNCGQNCADQRCESTGTGPGKSIHGSNALSEVITIAAVNKDRVRIGYSSQGEGMFDPRKPDLASYSHVCANFGPSRPGGESPPFDSGTSAATPVACGVGALLLAASPETKPDALKAALINGAIDAPAGGWDRDVGAGVIHAGGAFKSL